MPTPAFRRVEDSFLSDGVRCAASVYHPSSPPMNAPVIVMAHGFGSPRALRLPAYAERFAAAGYTAAVFDYRYFGDSEGQPRQLLDIPSQLDDWRAALAWARTLDGVDPERVVGWGTSFAGGHVITLAGTGEKLAAIIAQVPHVSGTAAVRATGLRHALRITPAALDDGWRAVRHRAPRYVNSVGAPGTMAVLATPDAEPALERMGEASGLRRGDFPETVAARVLLRVGFYSPIRHAANITCPALIQAATKDAIAPAGPAEKAAARMPAAAFRAYECDHFDVYTQPLFETVCTDQLAFLKSAVPVATGT